MTDNDYRPLHEQNNYKQIEQERRTTNCTIFSPKKVRLMAATEKHYEFPIKPLKDIT